MIKTKLVVTVGPASADDHVIAAMIDAGVDVFRLNFSHGTLDAHAAALERIRRLAAEHDAVVAVMGDLCGPKIRVGKIAGGQCELAPGGKIIIQREPIVGTCERLSSGYPRLIDEVAVGHRVLIDDGNILLRVLEKRTDELLCLCEVGGIISDHKGINLPDSDISAPALTDKDRTDLQWAMDHDLDYVALSFVRTPADVAELRRILQDKKSSIHVVSKIEKPQALDHLDDIIDQSDVVLVARGDLGVEMDVWRVPLVQKEIALKCQQAGKPVIIATQMLQSMVASPVPTRAEVSDVANAILDHADAVMLSAETSVGKYPLEAVRMTQKVAEQTELFRTEHQQERGPRPMATYRVAAAIVHGASLIAEEIGTRLVAVWTKDGHAARLLSKHRLHQPIVAVTPDQRVCRQMAMLYGVMSICVRVPDGWNQMLAVLDRTLIEKQWAAPQDQILVVAGTRLDHPDEVNTLFIHVISGVSTSSGKLNAPPGR